MFLMFNCSIFTTHNIFPTWKTLRVNFCIFGKSKNALKQVKALSFGILHEFKLTRNSLHVFRHVRNINREKLSANIAAKEINALVSRDKTQQQPKKKAYNHVKVREKENAKVEMYKRWYKASTGCAETNQLRM